MAKDNVIIRLGLDLPRFQKQLNQASSNMKKWGKDMQQVGSRLSTYLTAPLAAIGGFSVKAAADLQDIQSKFNIVFGEMAKETEAWANEFARSTNRAGGDLQKFLASIQDTLVPMGMMPQAAQGMSKEITALAVDLASFNNMNDADVVRDLTSALTGSGEVMKKYGVILSQSTVNQELLRMGIEGGAKAATEAEKAQARFNIIMAGTTAAQGNAIATNKDFNNVLKGVRAELGNAAELIGGVFLPMAEKILIWARDAIRWFNDLDKGTIVIIATIGALVAAVGPLVTIFGVILSQIPNMIAGFAALRAGALAMGKAFTFANLKLVAIPLAIAALIAAGYGLVQNWGQIVSWFDRKIDELTLSFVDGLLTMTDSVKSFASIFGINLNGITEDLENWKGSLIHNLEAKPVVEFGDVMENTWEEMKKGVSNAANAISSEVENMLGLTEEATQKTAQLGGSTSSASGVGFTTESTSLGTVTEKEAAGGELVRDMTLETPELIEQNNELAASYDMIGQSISSNLVTAFESLITRASTFEEALKQVVKQLIAVIIQQTILMALTGGTSAAMGPVSGGLLTALVPGFASGGMFGGGLRLVGENGPELEATGASRIFNARQTEDILSGMGQGAASPQQIEIQLGQPTIRLDGSTIVMAFEKAKLSERDNFGFNQVYRP